MSGLRGAQHPDEVRAAMDTHLMLLREMASVHPDKRERIAALISLCEVLDEAGNLVARVAYNGRVFPLGPNGECDYTGVLHETCGT